MWWHRGDFLILLEQRKFSSENDSTWAFIGLLPGIIEGLKTNDANAANDANDGDDDQMTSLFMTMLRWHLVVRGKVFGNKGKIPLEAIHGYYPEDLMVSCQIDKGKILLGATHIVSCRRLNGILPET